MVIPGQIFINYYAKEVCISNLFNTFVIYGYFNIIFFFLFEDLKTINFVLVIFSDSLLKFSHSDTLFISAFE